MAETISPIIIAAASTVGKSDLAHTLVDQGVAKVVTADKYYLYAGGNFWLGLGLEPAGVESARQPYLFGSLTPTEPVPTPEEYIGLASNAIDRIHSAGSIAIIEGCSYKYTAALVGHYGLRHAVYVTWQPERRTRLKQGIFHKFNGLVTAGLYEETERALDAGFGGTYPMGSLIYQPAIQVVQGNITHNEATRRVVASWTSEALRVDKLYAAMPGLLGFRD